MYLIRITVYQKQIILYIIDNRFRVYLWPSKKGQKESRSRKKNSNKMKSRVFEMVPKLWESFGNWV